MSNIEEARTTTTTTTTATATTTTTTMIKNNYNFNSQIIQPEEGTAAATGITIFLPGTQLRNVNYDYNSRAYDTLVVDQKQIVMSFNSTTSSANTSTTTSNGAGAVSHEKMAEDVVSVIKEFLDGAMDDQSELKSISDSNVVSNHRNNLNLLPIKYNVVGHSIGGKVAVTVDTKYDIENLKNYIAVHPVDIMIMSMMNSYSNSSSNSTSPQ